MTEQARNARRLYKREWNRRNPEKVKAASDRYWERRAAAAQEIEEATAVQDKQDAQEV